MSAKAGDKSGFSPFLTVAGDREVGQTHRDASSGLQQREPRIREACIFCLRSRGVE